MMRTGVPYSIEAEGSDRATPSLLASLLRSDPSGATYGIDDAFGDFRIRHGDVRLELPVIGRWPLRDLTPTGVADTLDRLVEEISTSEGHVAKLEAYVREAVHVAIALGCLHENAVRNTDGTLSLELCLEEDMRQPFLWIATSDPGGVRSERLRTDPGLIETEFVLPCRFFERSEDDGSITTIMTPSCSDVQGVAFESLAIDADGFAEVARRFEDDADPIEIMRAFAGAGSTEAGTTGEAA